MKTQSAVIKLMLLSQPNKQGLYPIVIRAQWNGRCEKRTGISVPKKYWSDKQETILKSYPNSVNLNNILQSKLQQVINRKYELEASGTLYHVEDLFDDVELRLVSKLDYHTLQTTLIKKHAVSYATSLTYDTAYNRLKDYLHKDNFDITELDEGTCISFSKYLLNQGLKNSTVFYLLSKIAAVWNFAIENELTSDKDYPFKHFKLRQHFKSDFKKQAITEEDFDNIRDILMNYLMYSKKERFTKRYTDEWALSMYVLGYYFGGLALIDMAKLKKNQIQIKQIDKCKYYIFDNVCRSKTNHPVPIIVEQNFITKPLMDLYMNTDSEYLFPLISDDKDQKLVHKQIESDVKSINLRLRRVTGLDITYYSCRHSFATHYLNTPGSNPIHLSTLMGRSLNGLFGYVKEIKSEEDIIRERQRLGI